MFFLHKNQQSLGKMKARISKRMATVFRSLVLFVGLITLPILSQPYELVWSDEFDGSEVDTSKWSFQIGDGCELPTGCGWGNFELQYYRAENATVSGGNLIITAKKESFMGSSYTSARLRTLGKGDWTFGRFEMRAILPEGQGLWPAFWLLFSEETYGGWAASGEIDIMELTGDAPATIFGTIHYGGEFPANVSSSREFTLPSGKFSEDYHIFAVEWEYGEIRWYVDDSLYATQTQWFSTGGVYPAPFDHNFHILLNVAVGGTLPGPPDPTTVFPQTMVVDYIRVYQALGNEKPSVMITSPADGAVLNPGENIQITVDASDPDGQVKKVEFFQQDARLDEDVSAPYQYFVLNTAPGCYEIVVKATDNLGGAVFDTVNVTVGSCGQAPYLMSAAKIPGQIEAENYDIGGPGVAYNDADPSNNGEDGYREDEGVDIERSRDFDFGFNVGWTADGEWLEYQVDVQEAGLYLVDLRVASGSGGGTVHLEFDGADKTGPITFGGTGGWQEWTTIRTRGIELDAGVQTMRLFIDQAGFNINHIAFAPDTSAPGSGEVTVFEDFEEGDVSNWQFFGGANGANGNGSIADGRPAEGNYYFSTSWTGAGSGSVFYGGFFNNIPNEEQLELPADPWMNVFVYIESATTTVDSFTLELTIREDTDGNGWTNGQEDSRRLDTRFGPSDFNDAWVLLSAPLTGFMDLGTGGNGFFDGKLDEVIVVISGVVGANPSDINIDFDFIAFSSGGPIPQPAVFDDFNDSDVSDWTYFGGAAGATFGGSVGTDHPVDGSAYFALEATGAGSGSVFYGGGFKNVADDQQLALPEDPWINVWTYISSATTVDSFTLELTIREDTDGNGWTNGQEDSRRLNTRFGPGDFTDQWILISEPVSSFLDLNTGGNGFFDGKLDEFVIVIGNVVGANPSSVVFDLDHISFTSGKPLVGIDEQTKLPGIVEAFHLGFAYPNPFNPATIIPYLLERPARVNLEVFNSLGQKIKTLVEQRQPAGRYTIRFDGSGLASGIYFYRLRADHYIRTRKMILMK